MDKRTIAEKFYYDLQNSRFRADAFEQWEEYRNKVTDLIIRNSDKGKCLAIFGPGHCNDMDLGKLSQHFSQVTLIDINEPAMLSALRRYKLTTHLGVNTIVKDFVGITNEDYIEYISIMLDEYKKSRHALNNKATATVRQLDHMYEQAKGFDLDFGSKKYDYSLVLNIHSQLNDTADWIWTHMMSLLGETVDDRNRISARINRETMGIVKKFNDAFFKATKEKVFIGYEIGIEGHNKNIGIQGAMQTYDDLRRREQRGTIKSVKKNRLTWPYDQMRQIRFSVRFETLAL